jgi:hypothetical protein
MSDENPSLQDIWKLLGTMNRRFEKRFDAADNRFDALERQMVELKSHVAEQIGDLRAQMTTGFGALRSMIEARDFRLDEHGRRISDLEKSRS